ncbi:hypothetical protein [uncultured Erythrobacter sp.]|uniref:hypothetical protein n=1 Tax=uncultured Erythrobacter sp. TaxID=263913 RepID=UPI0026085432|nr:hypothetical protein [uncultured Erythrobacter sp.]
MDAVTEGADQEEEFKKRDKEADGCLSWLSGCLPIPLVLAAGFLVIPDWFSF